MVDKITSPVSSNDLVKKTNEIIDDKQNKLITSPDLEIIEYKPLPSGYTALDYIASSGTQYIDTGYYTKANTTIKAKLFTPNSENKNIFGGTGIPNSAKSFVFNSYDSSQIEYIRGLSNWGTISVSQQIVGAIFTLEFAPTYININGSKVADILTPNTTDDKSLCIFVRNGGSAYFTGRIYNFDIWEDNVLVIHLVPAKRNSDNVVGLYDTVSDTFFTNVGTGTFTAGAVSTLTPDIIRFTNDSGYITGISSTDVTTALGFTPYSNANPSGYQANKIETVKVNGTALTPSSKTVDITVPAAVTETTVSGWGFTKNAGTVTKVNNVSPDANGNVTIPTGGTVDQTFNASSTNAQSGTAIAGAKFLQNTATGTGALTINGVASAGQYAVNIGESTTASANYTTALGYKAKASGSSAIALGRVTTASGSFGIAIGYGATCSGGKSIQLGFGTNTTAASMTVGFQDIDNYQLLDGNTGLIPDARLSSNIARATAIPTSTTQLTNDSGYITGITSSMVTSALGFTPYSNANPSGYQANVIETIKVNGTAQTPSSKTVSLTVPTTTTAVTSGSTAALTSGGAYSNLVRLAGAQTITGNKTFSGTVALGSSATATTPDASSNTTAVATTAFVKAQGYKTTVTSSDVTTALGYTPYNSTNPNGYITGITSSMVTTALGYTPYNSTNPNGYITGITSSMVTTALGFTPANANGTQTLQTIHDNGTSGSLSLSNGTSLYKITPSGATTISFGGSTSASSSQAYTFELCIDMHTTAYTITWPTITWQNNEAPDLSEAGIYFLAFRTIDGGSTWLGNLQGKW